MNLPDEGDAVAETGQLVFRKGAVGLRLLRREDALERHLVGQRIGVEHAVAVEDVLLLDHALGLELAGVVHRRIEVLEQVAVNLRKHLGREAEGSRRQQLGDALADQVGFKRRLVMARGMMRPHQLARLGQRALTGDVGVGRLAHVGGNLQAVHRLQPDGHGPVVAPRRLRLVRTSRLVCEVVQALGRHAASPPFPVAVNSAAHCIPQAVRKGRRATRAVRPEDCLQATSAPVLPSEPYRQRR